MKLLRVLHERLTREDAWVNVSQILVGLFFFAAGIYKLHNYFIIHDQSLLGHFNFWKDNHWPLAIYETVMTPILNHTIPQKILEALVVLLQMIPGILLVFTRRTRLAAAMLVLIQLNIFFGTFHERNFNELVGLSLWLCLYYGIRPGNPALWSRRAWNFCTVALLFIIILYLCNRYWAGDPWPSVVARQRAHFEGYIMPVSPLWKQAVLWVTSGAYGSWVWIARWWTEIMLATLFLTRFRLQAGAAFLVVTIFKELTWLNALTSQGVLWTLVLFVWVAQEELLQRQRKLLQTSSAV